MSPPPGNVHLQVSIPECEQRRNQVKNRATKALQLVMHARVKRVNTHYKYVDESSEYYSDEHVHDCSTNSHGGSDVSARAWPGYTVSSVD